MSIIFICNIIYFIVSVYNFEINGCLTTLKIPENAATSIYTTFVFTSEFQHTSLHVS